MTQTKSTSPVEMTHIERDITISKSFRIPEDGAGVLHSPCAQVWHQLLSKKTISAIFILANRVNNVRSPLGMNGLFMVGIRHSYTELPAAINYSFELSPAILVRLCPYRLELTIVARKF